jgi:hypothetical protein
VHRRLLVLDSLAAVPEVVQEALAVRLLRILATRQMVVLLSVMQATRVMAVGLAVELAVELAVVDRVMAPTTRAKSRPASRPVRTMFPLLDHPLLTE